MSISNINTLTSGTVNGLNSLSLDELTTTNFSAQSMNGDIFYIDRVEAKEVIVDTKLTLTSTGVISVGNKTISDIELTYLDCVNDNIQKQIDNIAGKDLQFQAQIDNHTNQINDLQASDASQNVLLENLEASVNTYDSRIETLEEHDSTQIGQISELQNKTQWQTSAENSTTFSKQISVPNGNIGSVNALYPNNFYIQSNLSSGNNIYLNSGVANTYLQSQNVYVGKPDASTGRNSNLLMLGSDGTTWETQSSAFTETHKADIATLNSKTSNITSANTTSTNTNKPLYITTNGECLRTIGNYTFWSGFDTANTTRHFAIGKETSTSNRLMVSNYTLGETVIQAGSRTGNTNLGQNKIITNSNGISLRRGGLTAGDTEVIAGEIGATGAGANLRIDGNGSNNIIISAGIGEVYCEANTLRIGTTIVNANGRKSNILMYDATGVSYETQSSAFTETLKSQIGTNASNITILQN